ncbi:Na+/H+ exchanger CtNHA1 [Spathaspora passalidarum NRRL Y-27907]|uniref:Na+/H+ exchanger CtNHA1 n=1 Tax=Spathaspora passalidarum (strain NRRL Y-27907 / 11-Y1) TaxID=619300 RepID=G3ASJ5_SPAPN|nr:Na+/H+ exchanger CtNHA1 [Spathaspora passalidarum NRRL Y-27907]EGW30681.1 Na+/H+ exchanger CtNHA1 [Spathaspora passalidarum NRRL Y-27907]
MVWSQLELEAPHIAYACVGIFSTLFSLVSLFVKERLYIGEATVATIAGLIIGPHCLDWFNPVTWGNTDYITLEICRIVLCIQIVAVAVELPRKYMKKHWVSVTIFLLPVMTFGWLTVGLFIWCLIPHFSFSDGLLVAACVTATDPVLAAAVVGKGKFAQRVPGHLRNLLSAESGCNDGMAFPFIFLALYIITHRGEPGLIVKDWFLLTIFWECLFGCLLGAVLGYVLRKLVAFAERRNLIDRESFLAIFVFLAFNSAGIGSMLGVDDLLVSFAAGTAFGWNGDFAKKTEESHVSTVIDLLLNLSFFVYFGAIIPWPQFNNPAIGLDVWRLVILAFVIIFLRRLPAVIAFKPFTPDVKTWREALFCGHFGPIGVGAIFAAILARKDLEAHYTTEETPLAHLPNEEFPHYQLLACIWPMVCFIVITSIVVHGSSVAVLTLGRRLNRMAITMSFTTTGEGNGPTWMQRLQKLDKTSTTFSLHRVDTIAVTEKEKPTDEQGVATGVETSGIKVRPAGGAKRRAQLKKKKKKKKKKPAHIIKKTLSKVTTGGMSDEEEEEEYEHKTDRQRPQTEFLQLGRSNNLAPSETSEDTVEEKPSSPKEDTSVETEETMQGGVPDKTSGMKKYGQRPPTEEEKRSIPTVAYQDGDQIIIEDQYGEIMDSLKLQQRAKPAPVEPVESFTNINDDDDASVHSEASLQRRLSQYASADSEYSFNDEKQEQDDTDLSPIRKRISRSISKKTKVLYRKDDPHRKKVYAHQVDDLIVIENEEGEIIRRYKVNRHHSKFRNPPQEQEGGTRPRSTTLVGKMKSILGFNESEPTSPTTPTIQVSNYDLEQGNSNMIIPHEGDEGDTKLEHKLSNMLSKKKSPPPRVLSDEDEEDSNESQDSEEDVSEVDSEVDSEEDSDEHETEVEKRRRLQALGKLPVHRHQDDEED